MSRECPFCKKTIEVAEAAFCPYCGRAVPAEGAECEEARQIAAKAELESDPVKRHKLLTEGLERYPDSLALNDALLMLGRLHERNPRTLDFSVIKCFLLHMYLTPKEFSEEKKREMRTELFSHPQLKVCQSLAPNAQAYTEDYLTRLSETFVTLFLKGSSHYTRSIFGFRFERRLEKTLSEPACDMMERIFRDGELEAENRNMLYHCFRQGYIRAMGNCEHLDVALVANNLPLPL